MTKEQIKNYDEQLKPCPFCKKKVRLHELYGLWYVICNGKVVCQTRTCDTPEQAIAAWNEREGEK